MRPAQRRKIGLSQFARAAFVCAALTASFGCTRDPEVKHPGISTSSHVSPPPVAVPRLPAGTFDQARSHDGQLKAVAARLSGDLAGARHAAEAAAFDWPANLDAWTELAADCRAAGEAQCALYAEFFRAKVEFLAGQPPRVAVLGFASMAAGRIGTHSGDYVYNQRTLDTALRLASFYDEREAQRGLGAPAPKPAVKPTP